MERIQVGTFSLRFRRAPFSTTKNYIWAVGPALWDMHEPRVHSLAAETNKEREEHMLCNSNDQDL